MKRVKKFFNGDVIRRVSVEEQASMTPALSKSKAISHAHNWMCECGACSAYKNWRADAEKWAREAQCQEIRDQLGPSVVKIVYFNDLEGKRWTYEGQASEMPLKEAWIAEVWIIE